jgi:signal peptidase I
MSPEDEEAQPEPEEAATRRLIEMRREGLRVRIHRRKGTLGGLAEVALIVVIALGMALGIQAWIVKPYKIPSGSMEPTLDIGQRILANRFIYHFTDPSIGDIIVFRPPAGVDGGKPNRCGVRTEKGQACPEPVDEPSHENFVKRIVAGPGDTLSIRDGHPVVNGVEKVNEPYITPCTAPNKGGFTLPKEVRNNKPLRKLFLERLEPYRDPCNLPKTITIPPNHYFMMGDNRGASEDSRFWGPIPRGWIIGEAFATYWPPNRWGLF